MLVGYDGEPSLEGLSGAEIEGPPSLSKQPKITHVVSCMVV